jgi:hypothetical protein
MRRSELIALYRSLPREHRALLLTLVRRLCELPRR